MFDGLDKEDIARPEKVLYQVAENTDKVAVGSKRSADTANAGAGGGGVCRTFASQVSQPLQRLRPLRSSLGCLLSRDLYEVDAPSVHVRVECTRANRNA